MLIFVQSTEPLYYGHQEDRNKCPLYGGVRFREEGFIWISVSRGAIELSVIDNNLTTTSFICMTITDTVLQKPFITNY